MSNQPTLAHSPDQDVIVAVLEDHPAGDYTHLFYDDPGSVKPPVGCRCGWIRSGSHVRHVADQIVAALRTSPEGNGGDVNVAGV